MELIDRILRAEREADEILRRADAEVRKIERSALTNAEILLSIARKQFRSEPGCDVAADEETLSRAEEDARAERTVAEERAERALSFVLSSIVGEAVSQS